MDSENKDQPTAIQQVAQMSPEAKRILLIAMAVDDAVGHTEAQDANRLFDLLMQATAPNAPTS